MTRKFGCQPHVSEPQCMASMTKVQLGTTTTIVQDKPGHTNGAALFSNVTQQVRDAR